MQKSALKNPLSVKSLLRTLKFFYDDFKNFPTVFRTFGTCVFCGIQGDGKTLSAVQYILKIREKYPRAILVTNVAIKDYPFNAYMDENHYLRKMDNHQYLNTDVILLESVHKDYKPYTIEYTGLDMLKYVNNNEYGVIFFIDEVHLELNSLESQNIDIEVMVEISQQRKQRKHIVGTSQIFMRMAKPLREQVYDVVLCHEFFKVLQYNKLIDGTTAEEKDGKLYADVKRRYLWFLDPDMFKQYDTYTKMRRYNKEWKGRRRIENFINPRGES